MAYQLTEEWTAGSRVSMEDGFVPRAGAENGGIPGNCTYAIGVSVHDSNSFQFVDIPDLDFPAVRA